MTKNKWDTPTSNGVPLEKSYSGLYREYIFYLPTGKLGTPYRASELIRKVYSKKGNDNNG